MTTQTGTSPSTATTSHLDAEQRADLLESLDKHRGLFLVTVTGMDEEQIRLSPTVSSLSLGGLVKHLTAVERTWAGFVVDGPAPVPDVDWANVDWSDPPPELQVYVDGFRVLPGETLAGLLEGYAAAAAATDELVASVDLAARQALPEAPWFEPGASWSALRVFVHLVAETAQHAGHADIIRETIDGHRSMG